MSGIIISIFIIGVELFLFNTVLNAPSADRDTSLTTKFCSSVWPGLILFTTIASAVTLSLCWWFQV
jgi:hypothetical protein